MLAAAAAIAIFVGAWTLLHVGFYERDMITDVPVYEEYGDRIARGEIPYDDFRVEYPPGALPTFAIPSLVDAEYRRTFEWLMLTFGVAALVLIAVTLLALEATTLRASAALAFAAASPLALGSVVLSRYDLWPAAVTAAALAALVAGRDRLGTGLLGLGIAVKIYPGVLLPLALAWTWRRRGRRDAVVCAGIAVAVVAVAYLPFAAIAPDGVAASLGRQLSRPLQIESLGSAALLAAHHLFGTGFVMESSHGSQNVGGAAGTWVGIVHTVVQGAALVAVWIAFARDRAPSRERLVLAAATAVVAFVALGKVLSPQFLIWLIPLVPLVGGRRGLGASALLATALVLTQLWFPFRYWDFALELDETASWLVLARDLVLVALLIVLWQGLRDRDADRLARRRPPVGAALD